jgi:hypothetical protein
MSRAQILLVAGLLTIAGCTMPKKPATVDAEAQSQKALGERIQKICALAEPERTAQIEKLKSESGFVLYCGK